MRKEPIDQLTVPAAPLDTVTIAGQHDTLPHRRLPPGTLAPSLAAASSEVWDLTKPGRVSGLRAG